MTDTAARTTARFAEYVKTHRKKRGLSLRQLARKAGIDKGNLVRIEQGKRVHSPRPGVLNRLANALGVPVTDLLTCVGYDVPTDLGGFIRSQYGHLPEDVVAEIVAYVERIASTYDIDPRGPMDSEDATQPLLTDS
ncbi:MAG TPA: helix-turn-helix transcriptional regulator [Streptosporangiaceae bacterium]|jgi:transcriptional regulator with XRE-family HTH domain